MAEKLVCVWCSAPSDESALVSYNMGPQRFSSDGPRWWQMSAGGRSCQCWSCDAGSDRKRAPASEALLEPSKSTRLRPLDGAMTAGHCQDAEQLDAHPKILRACNPRLAHLEEKFRTHRTSKGGGIPEVSISGHADDGPRRFGPRAEATQNPTAYGIGPIALPNRSVHTTDWCISEVDQRYRTYKLTE